MSLIEAVPRGTANAVWTGVLFGTSRALRLDSFERGRRADGAAMIRAMETVPLRSSGSGGASTRRPCRRRSSRNGAVRGSRAPEFFHSHIAGLGAGQTTAAGCVGWASAAGTRRSRSGGGGSAPRSARRTRRTPVAGAPASDLAGVHRGAGECRLPRLGLELRKRRPHGLGRRVLARRVHPYFWHRFG
jgi:hypothetical protein